MSLIRIVDAGGHFFEMYDLGNLILPKFPQLKTIDDAKNILESLKQIKLRRDDVVLCAYPKSGTHWLWEIVSMLLAGKPKYNKDVKESQMLEFQSIDELESLPSPRILNTHLLPDRLPDNFLTCGCKVIHVLRNPKDVAVSLYHHIHDFEMSNYNGSWNDFLPVFDGDQCDKCPYYSWFTYIRTWEDIMKKHKHTGSILNLWYEDLQKDTIAEIERVAQFLQVGHDRALVSDIVEKCRFKNMCNAEIEIKDGFKANTRYGTPLMYRKGVVGDWKNYFTVAQSERFDEIYRREMKGSGLEFKFYLDYL